MTLNQNETSDTVPAYNDTINSGYAYDSDGNLPLSLKLGLIMKAFGFAARNNLGYLFFLPDVQAVPFTLTVQENTTQVTPVFSAPAGSFTSGQEVPITVDFGFPVILEADDTITVNDQVLPPLETDVATTHVTYLYTVPEYGDKSLTLKAVPGDTVTGANERQLQAKWPGATDGTYGKISDGTTKLEIPRLTDAVGQWTAEVEAFTYHEAQADQEAYTAAVVELTMDVPENENLRDLIGDVYTGEDGVTKYSAKLALSLDGGKTLIPIQVVEENQMISSFTARMEINVNDLEDPTEDLSFVAELYQTERDENDALVSQDLLFGHYVSYDVEAPTPLTAADITVTKRSDSEDGSWPEPDETIYAYSAPKLTLEAKITGSGYTWSQVEWYTDNEQVARITDASKNAATAELVLLGTGTVNIYVRAVNGGVEDYQDEEPYPEEGKGVYCKRVATLTVGEGEVPYLTIPEDQLTVRSGEDVTVRWASNLVQKNAEYANNAPTEFTINVYQGTDTSGAPVQTHTVTYNPADTTNANLWVDGTPNQSYVLSGLTETAAAGAVSYTVTVSAQAAEEVPGVENPNRTFSDSAAVSVVAQPVSVKLDRPDSFYVTNSGTLELGYTLTSFDLDHNAAFELTVTDNASGDVVYHSDTADTAGGGRFSLDLSQAVIPDGFRTIYDVSVKAKNTAEPDWSRASPCTSMTGTP